MTRSRQDNLNPLMEPLEPRRIASADPANPTPGDGNDYIFVAAGSDDPVETIQPQAVPAQVAPIDDSFKWMDGTTPLRVTSAEGRVEAVCVDSWLLWPRVGHGAPTTHAYPSEAGTRELARYASAFTDKLVIDIEDWAIDIRYASHEQVDHSIEMFKQVLGWLRDERPNLKLGVYGMFSLADQYRSTALMDPQDRAVADPNSWWAAALPSYMQDYAKWQAANEYLRPIAEDVDFIAPSLYTRTTDIQGMWTQFAISTIDDSRRYGKPVYPFVWPLYHSVVPGVGHTPISTADWEYELSVIRAHADGAIVWEEGDYSTSEPWFDSYLVAAQADLDGGSVQAAPPAPLQLFSASDERDESDNSASALLALAA